MAKTPKAKKGQKTGFFALHKMQARQALGDLLGRPLGNILTLAVLALTLSLPATLYTLAKNIVHVTDEWQSPTQVTAYLGHQVSESDGEALAVRMASEPNVESAKYISPQEGLDQLREKQGFDQAVSLLDTNPLPGVVVVYPKSVDDSATVTAIASTLRSDSGVDEVRMDTDWLSRLAAVKNLVVTLAGTLSALMLVAVFLIVGNTLRLQVLSRKEEIQVMKLVGATDSFILRPYLYLGVWYGLLASVAAWLVTGISILMLDSAVATLADLYDSGFRLAGLGLQDGLLLVMLAIFVSLLAARLSAARHLREIEPV